MLGHEAGHAVIREMGIPVVGREEDAADIFATLMALMCTDAFADRVLANAALGWFFSDRARSNRRRRDESAEANYYDEHGMDLQRALRRRLPDGRLEHGKIRRRGDGRQTAGGASADLQDDYLNA